MSLIQKALLDEFVSSGKIKTILATTKEANRIAEDMALVSHRIANLATQISEDVKMLEYFDSVGDIVSLEDLSTQIEDKLEVFADVKLLKSVEDLKVIFKLNTKTVKSKKDLQKELGL